MRPSSPIPAYHQCFPSKLQLLAEHLNVFQTSLGRVIQLPPWVACASA